MIRIAKLYSGAYYADVGCALSQGTSRGASSDQQRPSEQYLGTALRKAQQADSVERTDLSLVLHGRIALAKGNEDRQKGFKNGIAMTTTFTWFESKAIIFN